MADDDTAEVELEEIRCGDMVFSGSSAPALHEHPINKDLCALQKQGRQCGLGDRQEHREV